MSKILQNDKNKFIIGTDVVGMVMDMAYGGLEWLTIQV